NVPLWVGVPLRTLPLNETPEGSAPLKSVIVGVGDPEAVTVKEPKTPCVNVVVLALVNAGVVPIVNVAVRVTLFNTLSDVVTWMVCCPKVFDVNVPGF